MDPDQTQSTMSDNDAAEWEQAELDYLSGKDMSSEKEQGSIDEQTKSKEGSEGEGSQEGDPASKKQNEEQGVGNDPEEGGRSSEEGGKPADGSETSKDEGKPKEDSQPATDPDAAERASRRAQLELEADRKELASDIREKMFSDKPTKLLDAEGQEIRTFQDVMQYRNPATGKNFTAEEASQWLMQAQRHLEETSAADQKEVDRIVDVNLTIKEEAAEVMEKYGALLAKNPNLRKQVWEDFKGTLQLSEDGEVITNAPISMKNYYDSVLGPHLSYANEQDRQANAQAEADKKAAAEKAAKEKKQAQSDRADLTGTRTKGDEQMDPEEKEWAEATKSYYED